MPRFLLPLILCAPLALLGCESPRSLETAQMAPALSPIERDVPTETELVTETVPVEESDVSMIGARSQVDTTSR